MTPPTGVSLKKQEKIDTFGEVFTPPEYVNKVLEYFPAEIWRDPSRKWLDNSCGHGAFLIEVKRKLMLGLAEWEPDLEKRERHIVEHMLFGVEIQSDNWEICRSNLGMPSENNNIVCNDALKDNYNFGKPSRFGNELFEI